MVVTEAAWDYTNKVAERGIKFGVALKQIRKELLSGEHPEDKIHAIELHMHMINDDLDEFLKGGD